MIPRVHGNGFIQLGLTDKIRLHVWPDHTYTLKRQVVDTGIHTHRFAYKSTLLTGGLVHREYAFTKYLPERTDEITHRLFMPGKDERLYPTMDFGTLRLLSELLLKPGDEYTFGPNRFHEIVLVASLSATLMEKIYELDDPPMVAVKIGKTPDNTFDRDDDNSEEHLWKIIKVALKRAGRQLP